MRMWIVYRGKGNEPKLFSNRTAARTELYERMGQVLAILSDEQRRSFCVSYHRDGIEGRKAVIGTETLTMIPVDLP